MTGSRHNNKVWRIIRRPFEIVLLRYLFALMILVPASMFILWLIWPGQTLEVLILDKSVPDEGRREHTSLSWMLTQEKIRRGDDELYCRSRDYYGFFPLPDQGFMVRDLTTFDSLQLDSLADTLDMMYIADTYGVYAWDFYQDKNRENRRLYGGLRTEDLDLLERMKSRGKTIVAEFNCLGPPTWRLERERFEKLFGVDYLGWTGRYFVSLDTTDNDVLPSWVTRLYREQHAGAWPFHDDGIVLVDLAENIVILESGTHLKHPVPFIKTFPVHQSTYGLPAEIEYPFWLEIVSAKEPNQVISYFELPVNARGDSLLQKYRVPRMFPAVIRSTSEDYGFYYLAGDFADNPIPPAMAYFKGIHWLNAFFSDPDDLQDRRDFFWLFYRPLVQSILSS